MQYRNTPNKKINTKNDTDERKRKKKNLFIRRWWVRGHAPPFPDENLLITFFS